MYGSPKYSDRHAHEPTPFRSLQTAFAPHGEGSHGFTSTLSFTGGTLKIDYDVKMKRLSVKYCRVGFEKQMICIENNETNELREVWRKVSF